MNSHRLRGVAAQFNIRGDFISARRYGSGHINDTYAVVFNQGDQQVRYLFQRINHTVFKDVPGLMENIARVTAHARTKLAEAGIADASRHALTLIPTRENASFHRDDEGFFWRAYLFVENATGYDIIENADQAFEAAKAFGAFQKLLVDLPGGRLNETIVDFHNTPKRFGALESAIAGDPAGRAAACRAEIEWALSRRDLASGLLSLLEAGTVPERVTHNDAKLNNVLLDDTTGEALCVIDLDTLMPGTALYDFGDLVRTCTSPAAEDERDLSKVKMQLPMYRALVRGYLAGAGDFLTEGEIEHLPLAGQVITFTIGLRFLTDHLLGDTYFRTVHPGHNLDRCRTQFRLIESMETQVETMRACT